MFKTICGGVNSFTSKSSWVENRCPANLELIKSKNLRRVLCTVNNEVWSKKTYSRFEACTPPVRDVVTKQRRLSLARRKPSSAATVRRYQPNSYSDHDRYRGTSTVSVSFPLSVSVPMSSQEVHPERDCGEWWYQCVNDFYQLHSGLLISALPRHAIYNVNMLSLIRGLNIVTVLTHCFLDHKPWCQFERHLLLQK